jgi:hypothetical protein
MLADIGLGMGLDSATIVRSPPETILKPIKQVTVSATSCDKKKGITKTLAIWPCP